VRGRRDDRLDAAVELVYFVALNSLGHLGFVGCRMTSTLFALKLGASPALAGTVVAMFAVVPMMLSVSAGRLIDRAGPRRPVTLALAALSASALLPFFLPALGTLLVSSVLLGVSFMLVHIGMNAVIGAHGSPERRAINFSWLALSFSVSNSIGPLVAGYAIQGFGYAVAFAVLAAFPALAFVLLVSRRRALPRPHHVPGTGERRLLDLLRLPGLRRTFIVSGMLATGWDLYGFLMPLYGTRLGIEPGKIGVIMATFAIATLVVRLALQVLIRRVRQWVLIAGSMCVAASSYLLFPFVSTPPLLIALSFVLGLGMGCSQPVIMSLLYEASPPGRQSEAVGVRTTMINASQTFIPLASGALSVALGIAPLFWMLSATLFGGAWFARHRIRTP
jgi:MFS family permease